MLPVLLSFGPLKIYSLGVSLVLSWCVFSFLFWKHLRSQAVEEERIFDMMFYGTFAAVFFARVTFVVTHRDLFVGNWLSAFALWVQPGLAFYGAVFGFFLTAFLIISRYRIRLAYMLDAFAMGFAGSLLFGLIGVFLDGSAVGKLTNLPWSIRYVGHIGRRHPAQLYEFAAVAAILLLVFLIQKSGMKKKTWRPGLYAVMFFLLFSAVSFGIEFVKESGVYWAGLNVHQWVHIIIFAEAFGIVYVKMGIGKRISASFRHFGTTIHRSAGGIYAKFSQRNSHGHPQSS